MARSVTSTFTCDRCGRQVRYQEIKSDDHIPNEGMDVWCVVEIKPANGYTSVKRLICHECRAKMDTFLASSSAEPEAPKVKRRRFAE